MKIKVRWQVEDGYVGHGPHYTTFDSNHYMDDEVWKELSREEKKQLIDEAIQEDFEQKISFSVDDYGI